MMKAPNSQEHIKQLNELNGNLQEKRQQISVLQKEANQIRTQHRLNAQISKVSSIYDKLNTTVSQKIQSVGKGDGSVSGEKDEEYKKQLQIAYNEMLDYVKKMQTEYQGKIKHSKHLAELESNIKKLDSEVRVLNEKKLNKNKSYNDSVQKYQQYMQQNQQEISKQRKKEHFEYLMVEKKKLLDQLNSKSNSSDEMVRAANSLKSSLPRMKKCTFDLKYIEFFFTLDILPPTKSNQIPQVIEKIDAKLSEIQKLKSDQDKLHKEELGSKVKSILEGHDDLASYRKFKLKELSLEEDEE
eukprot:NODE_884_length_3465_cov_0.227867.p2 type:complete len:298 gc:universal NODE_884_length_3465_cov_0.227867:260-1153(+)